MIAWDELSLRAVSVEAALHLTTPRTSFARIYETSFPPSERLDYGDLRRGLRSGIRQLYLAELRGPRGTPKTVGFATTCVIRGRDDVILGEYLAAAPDHRRIGIGGALFRFVVARLGDSGTDVIFEVEPPLPRVPNKLERTERIRFYENLGAMPVACASGYRVHNLARPGHTQPMILWWVSKRGTPPPCGSKLRECIRGIYAYSWDMDDDDPLIERVLKTLPCTS